MKDNKLPKFKVEVRLGLLPSNKRKLSKGNNLVDLIRAKILFILCNSRAQNSIITVLITLHNRGDSFHKS